MESGQHDETLKSLPILLPLLFLLHPVQVIGTFDE
jgi:hypothetical protein